MEVSHACHLKTPVSEGAKLKKMLAEQMIDVVTLKETFKKKISEAWFREECCGLSDED